MSTCRKATRGDLAGILEVIEAGFAAQRSRSDPQEGQEHRELFTYLYNNPSWDPEWVYLVEKDRKIASVVGFFPKVLGFNEIAIPVWAVSPVVTGTEFRGSGSAGECLQYALDDLKARGVPAVFLWGLPDYYPRFGFVPLLPRYKSKINPDVIKKPTGAEGRFRNFEARDIPEIAGLYNQSNHVWLQPQRNLGWWQERFSEMDIANAKIKEVPFPKKENFLVWENNRGEVAGYLNFYDDPNSKKIYVTENAASNIDAALGMLSNFCRQRPSAELVYLRGTPAHYLNQAAYRMGGMHLNPAPLAGMIKVIDWPGFLEQLFPLIKQRAARIGLTCLTVDFRIGNRYVKLDCDAGWSCPDFGEQDIVIQKDLNKFARLIFGLYDQGDLEIIAPDSHGFCSLLFPYQYPFIWDANYLY